MMRDLWVNWFEGEENGYNVCEFHEWRKDDYIELLDQAPLIKLSKDVFDKIENELLDIPQEILNEVEDKAFIRKNNKRNKLKYGFIAVNKNRVIVVNTYGYNIPMRKSRLIPRQHELALEYAATLEEMEIHTEPFKKTYNHLSPDPKLMYGLTRKERELKKVLLMAMDELELEKNVSKLRYLYSEWNWKGYNEVKELDFDTLLNKFINEIEIGWTQKHKELTKIVSKGQPLFEKIYELESA